MDDNLAIIILLAASFMAAVALIIGTRWMRAFQSTSLRVENEQLRAQVRSLTKRLTTLEEIATDPGMRISREIEQLR